MKCRDCGHKYFLAFSCKSCCFQIETISRILSCRSRCCNFQTTTLFLDKVSLITKRMLVKKSIRNCPLSDLNACSVPHRHAEAGRGLPPPYPPFICLESSFLRKSRGGDRFYFDPHARLSIHKGRGLTRGKLSFQKSSFS